MRYWFLAHHSSDFISHQPLRQPFLRIRRPFSTREDVIRLTVEADFLIALAISVCVILGLSFTARSTANSSKVQFKVSNWDFGVVSLILWISDFGSNAPTSISRVSFTKITVSSFWYCKMRRLRFAICWRSIAFCTMDESSFSRPSTSDWIYLPLSSFHSKKMSWRLY